MKIRQLTAEGRRLYARLYAAVLDSGERRVVLSSEGDTAPTTDLLVWAGNNLPVLLDALDEAEEARARAAELETFVRDLAAHGLRCDLTPTMDFASAERLYTRLTSYRRDVDTSLRERAQEAIARADREDRR
ncbi:hypothetical protein [Nocardia farcinica]|uniref:hypothetical protein n=1 Tax=Nocardia farcinica TaxID=37329 RepID=UPI0024579A2A|nr:hypothetical protein [Nocardia farcinica]